MTLLKEPDHVGAQTLDLIRKCVSRFGLCVMRFDDAPKVLRDLSETGGDEEWVIVGPIDEGNWTTVDQAAERLAGGPVFAVYDSVEWEGLRVYITAHA